MEWLGTGFTLTVGGLRLRVRIALEDTPCVPVHRPDAAEAAPPWPPQPAPVAPQMPNSSSFN
jgi:hypothetical protein